MVKLIGRKNLTSSSKQIKKIDKILAKHNIPILSLRPGKRKKAKESTTDALIKGRPPVK